MAKTTRKNFGKLLIQSLREVRDGIRGRSGKLSALKTKPTKPARALATKKRRIRAPRVADEIMAGMRELEHMLNIGAKPEELFKVKTVLRRNTRTRS